MEMGNLQEAITWFRNAKSDISDVKVLKTFTVLLQNMAATFNSLHQNDSALHYLLPSIEYAEEVQNLRSLANGHAIHADILIDLKRIEEAEMALNKALDIRKKIGDPFYVLSDMYQLSLFYSNVKQCEKGIQVANEGIVLASKIKLTSTDAGNPVSQKQLPDFKKWGDVEIQSMNKVRVITAEAMTYAWSTIPMVTQSDKADITELEEFRKKYSKSVEEKGGHLTLTSMLVKVCSAALNKFPQFNSSIDLNKKEIIFKKYFNIGIAVDTDRGLLVPVS